LLIAGAISSSEMLTAFHVLGIHTKRSEVEQMLAEVDADGSGEVMSYPDTGVFLSIIMGSLQYLVSSG
jgi:Ca2+-binding EF-hand superfamily protein